MAYSLGRKYDDGTGSKCGQPSSSLDLSLVPSQHSSGISTPHHASLLSSPDPAIIQQHKAHPPTFPFPLHLHFNHTKSHSSPHPAHQYHTSPPSPTTPSPHPTYTSPPTPPDHHKAPPNHHTNHYNSPHYYARHSSASAGRRFVSQYSPSRRAGTPIYTRAR